MTQVHAWENQSTDLESFACGNKGTQGDALVCMGMEEENQAPIVSVIFVLSFLAL